MSTAVVVATLDLIENALLIARFELVEVVRRAVRDSLNRTLTRFSHERRAEVTRS